MPLRQRVRDPSIDIRRLSRRNKRSRDIEIVSHREEDDGPQFYELKEFPVTPIPATSMETRDWEGASEASPTKKPFKTPLENISAPPWTADQTPNDKTAASTEGSQSEEAHLSRIQLPGNEAKSSIQSMPCSPGNRRDAISETVDSTKSPVKETSAVQLTSVQFDGGQEKSVGLSSGWTVIATGTSEKQKGTEKAVPDRITEDATASSTGPAEKAKTLELKSLVLRLPIGASKAQTSEKVQGLTGGVLNGSPGTDEHVPSALESSDMGQPGDSRSLAPRITQETSSQSVLNCADALRSNPYIAVKDSPKEKIGTATDRGKDESTSITDNSQLVLTQAQGTASASVDRSMGQSEPSADGRPIGSMQNLGDGSVAVSNESARLTTTSPVGDIKPPKDENVIRTSPVASETNAVPAERADGKPADDSPGERLDTAASISLASQNTRDSVEAGEIKEKSQSGSPPANAIRSIKQSCRRDDENKTEENRGPFVTGRIGGDATLAKHVRTAIAFSESPKLERTVRAVPIDGIADGTTTHKRSTERCTAEVSIRQHSSTPLHAGTNTSIADSLKPLTGMAWAEQASTRMSIDPESPKLYILDPSFNISDEKVKIGSQHRSESGEAMGARMDESMPVDTLAKNKSEEKSKVKEIAVVTTSPLGYPKEQAIGMEIEGDKVETVVGRSSTQDKSLPGGLLPSHGDDETSMIAKTIEHTIMGASEKRQEPDGPPGGPVAPLMQALLVEEIQWELERAWSAWGKLARLCGPHG